MHTLPDSHQLNQSTATMIQSTADQLVGTGSSLAKRKAAYVTIETLVNSHYNIDLQRLNDELRALKWSHDIEVASAAAAAPQAAAESAVDISEETKENKEPSMRRTSSRSVSSLAKYHHQSRLQPPRDGFNLCV